MTVYDSSLVYCEEEDVERYAAYDFDAGTKPTESQVYDFAQDSAATIEEATEAAGNRIAPPNTNAPTTSLARIMEQANAIGAAWLARDHMATLSGSQRDRDVANRLAMQWEVIMGIGSSSDGTSLAFGTDGTLSQAIASQNDADSLANDVTAGEVSLKSQPLLVDVEPAFTVYDDE